MSTLDDARAGMDPDIRPQDDLFGHVNGHWLETAEIPADKGSWGPFVQLADDAEAQVRTIIEELAERVVSGEQDLGDDAMRIACLYASFMDEAAVESRGAEPMRPLLAAVESLRDVRDLAAFSGEFEQIGGSGLFGLYVDVDARDSERSLINLLQGGTGLPDETYYRDEKFADIREKYVGFLTTIFTLIEHADPATAAATVMRVETRLAQGHWERAETRDVQKTYNLTTLEDLHALCPAFDWDVFVRNLGGSEITISETCVRQPSFFAHLSTALEEVPIEDWRTWLLARVVRACAPYLSSEFVEANFDFYARTLAGTPQLRERWKRGVALVEGSVGEAVGRIYVERHFPPDSKAMMEELVGNLLAAYRQSITALDWMSEETKRRAFDKLDMFRSKIGYPDTFRDYSWPRWAPRSTATSG
jgi:putative endopeptidase